MGREKIDNVFTPRSALVNKKMYISRDVLEKELLRKIRGTQHIIIHGESGCGKSWLYKNVFSENGFHYEVINLAIADTYKSIAQIFELETATGQSEKIEYTEKVASGIDAVIVNTTLDHESKYLIRSKESLYKYLDKFFAKKGGFICFENLETIFSSSELMKELGNLIILLDDEKFAKYNTKFIIIGVPADILNYYSNIKNLSTVTNRVVELSEVTGMNDIQVRELLERGFIDKLKVKFKSSTELDALIKHITFITSGVPQNVHEYASIIAFLAEENAWEFKTDFIEIADKQWLKDSLYKNYKVIQELMNSENTSVGRRNQVLYSIGKIEKKSFTLSELEDIVKKEFPFFCKTTTLNLSLPLGDIMENKISFIKKQDRIFYITDRKFILCIRTMLKKTIDEKVVRVDLSEL